MTIAEKAFKLKLKTVNSLPRCASSKRLRYEKQTEAPNSFRLLLVEVLHGGKVLENEEYRKKSIPNHMVSVGFRIHLG